MAHIKHKQPKVMSLGSRVGIGQLERACSEIGAGERAVLDLSAAARLDWMALALLVAHRRRLRFIGGELAVVTSAPQLHDALSALGVAGGLLLFDNVSAAQAAVEADAKGIAER